MTWTNTAASFSLLLSPFSLEPLRPHTYNSMAIRNPSYVFVFAILCVAHVSVSGLSDPSDRPHNFIVHVAKSQKPSRFASHTHWYDSIVRSLPHSPHPSKILYTYHRAVNGFSARITAAQAAKLRDLPGVLSVYPDQIHQIHTTHTPRFLGLADGFGIWPNSDYADDVIVGVLDTGISPDRPSFSDADLSPVPATWKGACETGPDFPASSCNRKIIGARAFYKGYEAYLERPMDESKESKSARDTEGHGTHTASTAAGSVVPNASFLGFASGEAKGMATKARIAAYKICWDLGCFDSDILAAFDQAVEDGVHVISLSVGTSGYAPQYYQDSISIGAFGAAQHGVVVSCSAGNSGPRAFTAVNIAPWILTVGASTVDREFPADAILGDGRIFGGVSLYSGEQLGEDAKVPLVYGGDCGSKYCYSGQLNSSQVAGKIVVCDRGGNARVAKGSAVKLAGGVGLVLANTDDIGEELIADAHLIPATTVGAIAGEQIRQYAKLGSSPTATIMSRGTVIGSNPAAPKVASFSSRGPNHRTPQILKPDVIAPGVNILAGWTSLASPTDLDIDPRRTEFNIISGTSMACPHASGLAALLRKAYPDWSPAAIKSALMTTAYNVDNSGDIIGDLAGGESTPFVRGAGHVDPNRALNPGLIYDISTSDYVSFLCAIGYNTKQISIFTREPPSAEACAGAMTSPGNLNYPSFSVVFGSNNDVVTYKRSVKNVGRSGDAVYEVKVNAPADVDVSVSPSKLVFSGANQTLSYDITFSGVGFGRSSASSGAFGSIEWSDGRHIVRSPIAVKLQQGLSDFI